MNFHVISAIFRRNFVSYFSNPTGYVFICVFVLLSSFAAFWPSEFFNANLANLDQLNKYLPYIMLVFIPAITMSIWADERRQGTDELLLTIPASDFDVVLGKYLAAASIFAVSLLFSLVSNFLVLSTLGNPDAGLLIGTYIGYFIVGLAMLGIGMVASFLTGNLTVGFILGALFNAPLVFAASLPEGLGLFRRLSISEQFRDFSRGVISFASIGYFLAIVALALYLSVVLIGRRHWPSGQGLQTMVGHYATRFLALVAIVIAANVFLTRHDRLRFDVTSERLNSLAPESLALLKSLDPDRPVTVEYFLSPNVPETFVQTKLNVMSTVRELEAAGGDKLRVIPHIVEPFSDEAARAEKQYGIKAQDVQARERGALTHEEVYMGLVFTCGLDKVIVPFLDKGIPVEYELVRSIATVSQKKRKTVGVLVTDARLFGQIDFQTGGMSSDQPIIDELKKQYEVVRVDPAMPITEKYDVLLAVQPSSLAPDQMDNFIAVVKSGQPTAIFEDPFPYLAPFIPGTTAPKQPAGGNPMFGMGRPEPKGDINELWRFLGVDFSGDNVVWQDYNPMPKIGGLISREWVFVDGGSGAKPPFNTDSKISEKLQQVLFLFPGAINGLHSSKFKFTPLVLTSDNTGTVRSDQIMERSMMGSRMNPNISLLRKPTHDKYVIAAQITSKKSDDKLMSDQPAGADLVDETAGETAKPVGEPAINVVVVSDLDCIMSAFFALRAGGEDPDAEFLFNFDNVPFALNVIDILSGDDRFVEIRTRRPVHRTLTRVSQATEAARGRADKAEEDFEEKYQKARANAQRDLDERLAKLRQREGLNPQQALMELAMAQQAGERERDSAMQKAKNQRDTEMKQARIDLNNSVRQVQDGYKRWAVLLPPIPPLIVAFIVFFNRRAKETEGVSKARLR